MESLVKVCEKNCSSQDVATDHQKKIKNEINFIFISEYKANNLHEISITITYLHAIPL